MTIKKTLVSIVGSLWLALTSQEAIAQYKEVVHLDGIVYRNLVMQENKIYRGNVPPGRINQKMKEILTTNQIPPDLMDNQYTTLTGGLTWGTGSELERVQVQADTVGMLLTDNSFKDSIIYSSYYANGLNVPSTGNPVRNCIFAGMEKPFVVNDYSAEQSPISYNMFCFSHLGMELWLGIFCQHSYNIYTGNDYNVRILGYTPSPTKLVLPTTQVNFTLEDQFFYSKNGVQLVTEPDILASFQLITKTSNVDVTPYQTADILTLDTDNDGLKDLDEGFFDFDEDYLVNAEDPDDDNDTYLTRIEIQYNTDPFDPTSFPQGLPLSTAGALAMGGLIALLAYRKNSNKSGGN